MKFLQLKSFLHCCSLLLVATTLNGCTGMGSWGGEEKRRTSDNSGWGPVVGLPEAPRDVDGYHVVKSGETLYSIAFRNGVDFRQLAVWNRIDGNFLIVPGQRLRLSPPDGTAVVSGTKPVNGTKRPTRPKPVPTPPTTPFRWQWPTSKGQVIKGYAPPASKGIDIHAKEGTSVRAAAPGSVVYSGSALKGYGELIIVKHDETYLSAYGYNRKRLVKEGDFVKAGQKIAEMGLGPQSKAILHFEIRINGDPINPLPLLPNR